MQLKLKVENVSLQKAQETPNLYRSGRNAPFLLRLNYIYKLLKKGRSRKTLALLDRYKLSPLSASVGGEQLTCGYDQCMRAMDFHHINPDEKEFELAESWGKNWAVI